MNTWYSPGFFFKPRYRRDGRDPADMVVLGAKVLTCDGRGTRAQAVAVRDGRFIYVGSTRGVTDHVGQATMVVNARGRMLTPGFIDNHVHLLWMGLHRAFITDFYDCGSFDEVLARAKEHADANPDLPVVMGIGWRYDYGPESFPEREMLEAVLPDRPAFLLAYDACTLWTNRAMLEIMYERNPRACRRMHPELDADGEPTGLFMTTHSFDPFEFFSIDEFPPGMKEKMLDEMAKAVRKAVSVGVTTFDELQVYMSWLPLVLELRDSGALDIARARAALYVDPIDMEDEDELVSRLEKWKELGKTESGERLMLGKALKLYIDGTFGNHTSFMLEPFSDTDDDCGSPAFTQEQFDRLLQIVDGMELQTCTHAIGDAGIRSALDSIERSRGLNRSADERHRLEHCELPLPGDIERMKELGVQAGMQPTQFFGDESFERTLGIERLRRLHPWRSIQGAGVNISFGTDYIAGEVPPVNPIYGLMIAATRINYHMNTDWGPGEAITLEDAIEHYTLGGAKALFLEDELGSIEVGKRADFVMFSTDLLKLDSLWFLMTNDFEVGKLDHFVEMTVVGGSPVYLKGEGAGEA